MNTETLKTFVQLAELKNYTHVANSLFVAQSTVTNRIQELENELNKTLIIRSKKQLSLTADGQLFLSYAKRILKLQESAINELNNREQFKATIRIGSTNTIYDCHLAGPLMKYQTTTPQTKLCITIGHSNPLIQMLQDNFIDLAFTYVPYTKKNILCQEFKKDPLILVTNTTNTEYKKGIRKDELSKIPYYYCDFPFQDLGSYIKELFPVGHSFPLEIDRSANLIPFLLSGQGYSFLPESMVNTLVADGRLITIPLLDFSIPDITCYVLRHLDCPKEALALLNLIVM